MTEQEAALEATSRYDRAMGEPVVWREPLFIVETFVLAGVPTVGVAAIPFKMESIVAG